MNQSFTWRCPSNIALVKYWGKKNGQIPCNASVSMTLQNAFSEVSLELAEKKTSGIELQYFFDNEENRSFGQRVLDFVERNATHFPVVNQHALIFHSTNSFPHSTGIASSASAFGAIALSLLTASGENNPDFFRRASFLSRLGSGSACRSMYGGYALWGAVPEHPASNDAYAIPVANVHENFSSILDAILIVDRSPKKVSSSRGHAMMAGHPYATTRFDQANRHCDRMLQVLATGDWEEFIRIIEQEALALHAMMMTSGEAYLLMKPGTIHAIEKIRNFRKDTGISVCFTLDAGPNVHVLYPSADEVRVHAFLTKELGDSIEGIIYDKTGKGPEQIL